jgi:uncharacterized protein (TIGR04255 family)
MRHTDYSTEKTHCPNAASDKGPGMNTTQEQPLSRHRQGNVRLELRNPPVFETSVGFYFNRVEGWHVLHQGLLWARFRERYPDFEILPPIINAQGQLRVELDIASPIVRTGFVDKAKNQLVQIQDGLLFHNWRKTEGLPEYMRYGSVRSSLRDDWTIFGAYLRQENLKEPSVTRCEMTYFNGLVRGEDWEDFSELADIFTSYRALPAATSFGTVQIAAFTLVYKLPTGIVNVGVQPAIRAADGKEIIQFALTSIAVPKSSDEQELFHSLDECHENAKRAFVDLTTDKARERWKQE